MFFSGWGEYLPSKMFNLQFIKSGIKIIWLRYF